MSRIMFGKPPRFNNLGRNGYSWSHGVEITAIPPDEVYIEPINSRGDVTQCRIVIDRAAVPELIKVLQQL